MKRYLALLFILYSTFVQAQPDNYVWNSQSKNSSESMPCGGHDIGMNVWVEHGEILFYMCKSGSFDENNTLLKQGRFRIKITPSPFTNENDFQQILSLKDGHLIISSGGDVIDFWVDVFKPVAHVDLKSNRATSIEVYYENWRYKDRILTKAEGQQSSYKWGVPKGHLTTKDSISAKDNCALFYHRNPEVTVFDFTADRQGLEDEKIKMYNPIKNRMSGGKMFGSNLIFTSVEDGNYADTDYKAWVFKSKRASKKHDITIILNNSQSSVEAWKEEVETVEKSINYTSDRKRSAKWWSEFWNRSYLKAEGEPQEMVRNYNLFRYMLACNAFGEWPTKFNGGLFTFDPIFVDSKSPFTPDYRKWGGGTMTAQNQRLVYWPMLKNGDFDMMKPQFDFYLRILPTAELRSKKYWGHNGGCFTEQIENFGLPNPAEYGLKRPVGFDMGLEYNAWLEYEWDTVLEFCQMIIDTKLYNGDNIDIYIPLIESALTFFDEHYKMRAGRVGNKLLDENGKMVIYPGSGCETYKMAYNPSSTVSALRKVLQTSGLKSDMLDRVPEIPLRTLDGKQMIAPAVVWQRVNNVETSQLYPIFPWRIYGIGRADLEIAKNTYLYDPDAIKFRDTKGWKQDNIWAACLGMVDEAAKLNLKKMSSGPYRFSAFWGPGYDWSPDHNWGGSGMIGVQEMLLQEVEEKIYLFPSWPKSWNVRFKLHASNNTVIEAEMKNGEVIIHSINPKERATDIIAP